MKGLFIPEITAEMFRNGCLESIEALMAEGKIYDIEYSPWIPVSEMLPKEKGEYFITLKNGDVCLCDFDPDSWGDRASLITATIAWMKFKPYKPQESEGE